MQSPRCVYGTLVARKGRKEHGKQYAKSAPSTVDKQ